MSAIWGFTRNAKSFFLVVENTPRSLSLWKTGCNNASARELNMSASQLACKPCSVIERSKVWKILEMVGLNKCRVIRIRRKLKRYSYPWLCYSIPAATLLATGDIIGQYLSGPEGVRMSLSCFFSKYWKPEHTIIYFLKGLLLVGPILSWWNLFWFRKLRCKRKLTFLLMRTLLDVFILAPLLFGLMAFVFDQTAERNVFTLNWEENKKALETKYTPAVVDLVMLALLTKPLMVMLVCFLFPPHLRRSFRALYKLAFAVMISKTFRAYKLREQKPKCPPPPPPPPPPETTPDNKCKTRSRFCRGVKKPGNSIWRWPC